MNLTNVKAITIPEGNVSRILSGDSVLWLAGPLPSAYQEVEYISAEASVGAYIDLGFAFDTKAKIEMSQYIVDHTITYLFGAAENSGKLRCMISSPYPTSYTSAYGHDGTTYITLTKIDYKVAAFNEFVYTLEKENLHIINTTTGYENNSINQVAYTMTNHLYLFGQNYNGTLRYGGTRRIGYFRYYDKNDELFCSLIPCYRKSDGVIGMYDVIRKQFYTNAGTGSFEKGADVGFVNLAEPNDTNTADYSIWINDARMGSDATYRSSTNSMVTNYILVSENEEEETTLYFAGTGLTSAGNGVTAGCCIALFYGNDKVKWAGFDTISGFLETYPRCSAAYYDDGTLKSIIFKVGNGNPPYHIRFCLSNALDKSKIIISKDPIE